MKHAGLGSERPHTLAALTRGLQTPLGPDAPRGPPSPRTPAGEALAAGAAPSTEASPGSRTRAGQTEGRRGGAGLAAGGAQGPAPSLPAQEGPRGSGSEARLTLRAGISTLSPRLMEPERMVPVITVPWPLMEKQWSTDMRNGPEGSLVGMQIWDVRSWRDRLVPHPGRRELAAMVETSRLPTLLLSDFIREDTVKSYLVPNSPESWSCGNDSFGKRPECVSRPSPEASDRDTQTRPAAETTASVSQTSATWS